MKDQSWDIALFNELASTTATLEASRTADIYSCFEGNDVQVRDVEQAYLQAEFDGEETWVALPPEAWPKHWKGKYKTPVVKLEKALLFGNSVHSGNQVNSGGFFV